MERKKKSAKRLKRGFNSKKKTRRVQWPKSEKVVQGVESKQLC